MSAPSLPVEAPRICRLRAPLRRAGPASSPNGLEPRAPCAAASVRDGTGCRDRPYLENCTVDASIL